MSKPSIHLICNAHLDPVWQWTWEEGVAEALTTFSTAAAILEEHPSLIFCHNEAWLYQQVEKLAPELFRRIRRLVRAGRWAVSGGWFLQPDTNLPGVESLIRHIVFGRRYFRSRFGKTPLVAYNFDSFGHSGGLPQILRQSGFKMYIHMRPQPHELVLPSDLYLWRGVDGTTIMTYRIAVGLYHTERDNIEERLSEGVKLALELNRDVPVFWGLGNHGGGPTRKDLAIIDAWMAKERRVRIRHSTPDRFYRAVAGLEPNLPVHCGDLQRVFTGCYTSLSRLKRRSRESLGLLLQTETLRTACWRSGKINYPEKDLNEAWAGHLFNDFHDIITGSCVSPAERDAHDLYGFVSEKVRRLRLEGLAQLCSESDSVHELPLAVFNSNPSVGLLPIEVEVMSDYRPFWKEKKQLRLFRNDGSKVVSQEEPARALLPFHDWRRKVVFLESVSGIGLTHYHLEAVPANKTNRHQDKQNLKNKFFNYKIDPATGLVNSFQAQGQGQVLTGSLLEPVLIEDSADSWGTATGAYRKLRSRFHRKLGPQRIISGPVRTIFRTVSISNSKATQLVTDMYVYHEWPVLDFRCRVISAEPQTRLKLKIPTVFQNGYILAEIPGGAIERPADGEEHVHGRWLFLAGRVNGKKTGLGIVHSGCPGFDFLRGEIRLSVYRTSAFCHERGFNLNEVVEPEFSDLGSHEFRVLVMTGSPEKVLALLPGLADYLDQPPFCLGHLPASGKNPVRAEFFRLSPSSVRLLAYKRSEDGRALVIRLQESAGRKSLTCLSFPQSGKSFTIKLQPFEIKTLRVGDNESSLREASLIERSK